MKVWWKEGSKVKSRDYIDMKELVSSLERTNSELSSEYKLLVVEKGIL